MSKQGDQVLKKINFFSKTLAGTGGMVTFAARFVGAGSRFIQQAYLGRPEGGGRYRFFDTLAPRRK
jgi:hypothetical protein